MPLLSRVVDDSDGAASCTRVRAADDPEAPPPDEEVLGRVARGELDALGLLYDRYCGVLLALALRIVQDRQEAEDIVHDAFMAVLARGEQYRSERGSVAAWLIALTRNLSIDRMRGRDRRGAITRDVLAHEPARSVASPEALAGQSVDRQRIASALAALPEDQRATLEVAFFEGLTYLEIATREGLPLGTVKSRAARGLARLQDALTLEGEASVNPWLVTRCGRAG